MTEVKQEKKWYVVRAVSGQENKIKSYIENEISRLGLESFVDQVLVPTENVIQIRKGKKIQKEKDKVVHDWSDEGVRVEKARWGRHHIIRGKQKVEIGKEVDASKLSLEDAERYLGKIKTKPKKKAAKKR